MNRHARRIISKAIKGKSPYEQMQTVSLIVASEFSHPYDDEEFALAREVGQKANGPFYHGGPTGLTEILPAGQTGASRWKGSALPQGFGSDRLRWAFFTKDYSDAEAFAKQATCGSVYLVEPRGEVLADMDRLRPALILSQMRGTKFHTYRKQLGESGFREFLSETIRSFCASSAAVLEVVE